MQAQAVYELLGRQHWSVAQQIDSSPKRLGALTSVPCYSYRRHLCPSICPSHAATVLGAVLRWGRGARAPRFTCCAPQKAQIQKLADCSDVISEVPKCPKVQIFRGSSPDPAGPLDPLADGRGSLPPPKNPSPFSADRVSFLRVSGSNHYRVGNHDNDRFQI